MARTTRTPPSKTLTFRAAPRRKSLSVWTDASRQANILDWGQRAHGFGLDVDEREGVPEGEPSVQPERLRLEEEPEALWEQPIHAEEGERDEHEEEVDRPVAAGPREEIEVVCVYLKHVGQRKLLKKHRDVETSARNEKA